MPTSNYILPDDFEFSYDEDMDTYQLVNTETGRVVKETTLSDGYKFFSVRNKCYKSHILVYQYANEDYNPNLVVDHIDQNPSNNRVDNLRQLTRGENKRNSNKNKGYYWNKKSKKYRSYIKINKVNVHLGYFFEKCAARKAYKTACRENFPGINANFSDSDDTE